MFARTRWNRSQGRTAEEGYLNVARKNVEREKPAIPLVAVEWRVPLHSLLDLGDGLRDYVVDTAPDFPLPARHGGDISLYRRIPVTFCNLRIAAGQQLRFSLVGHVPYTGTSPKSAHAHARVEIR